MSTDLQSKSHEENQPPGNFVNQPHQPATHKKILGTNTIPDELRENGEQHIPEICPCGSYHSNLSQDALDMRLDYQAILRHGGNPMELMMNTMQFMRASSMRNAPALDELLKDDMKRQQLGVMDEQIEVPIDNTALDMDKQIEFAAAMSAMQQMGKIVAPRVQQNWDEVQQQQQQQQVTQETQLEEEDVQEAKPD